jgi:hypothetical protein
MMLQLIKHFQENKKALPNKAQAPNSAMPHSQPVLDVSSNINNEEGFNNFNVPVYF